MKHNQHSNPEGQEAMRRGVEGLRAEPADMSAVPGTVSKMLSEGRKPQPMGGFGRYLAAGGAFALLGAVAFWPRVSNAASLHDIIAAVRQQSARYERIYKPDRNGKLELYMEQWGEPGKYAMKFVEGTEARHDGNLSYVYWPQENRQRIEAAEGMEIDEVGVETFAQFKLLRIENESSDLRYVYKMMPSRQDLVVDSTTKLPLRREVFNADGSIMEVHEYHFKADLDDKIFQPQIKPGIPLIDIPKDRATLAKMFAQPTQTQTVAGVKVQLHAVILGGDGNVAAVVTGGDPRAAAPGNPMRIVGLPEGTQMIEGPYSVYAGIGSTPENTLKVAGQTARVDNVRFMPNVKIPREFTLRVPVWKLDPNLPLLDYQTKKKVGSNSRLVGWASFKVKNPLVTEAYQKVLPNYVLPPAIGTAKAGG